MTFRRYRVCIILGLGAGIPRLSSTALASEPLGSECEILTEEPPPLTWLTDTDGRTLPSLRIPRPPLSGTYVIEGRLTFYGQEIAWTQRGVVVERGIPATLAVEVPGARWTEQQDYTSQVVVSIVITPPNDGGPSIARPVEWATAELLQVAYSWDGRSLLFSPEQALVAAPGGVYSAAERARLIDVGCDTRVDGTSCAPEAVHALR